MKEIVMASHQPDFFPYMGYFYKIFKSDVFVFSDSVQYSKTGRHNYNSILTANGPMRLTLPIHYKVANLNEIQIAADERWVEKTLKTIRMAYHSADCFDSIYPILENLILGAVSSMSLAEYNMTCIMRIVGGFGWGEGKRRFVKSSNLLIKNRKDARIIEICGLLNATTYLSGDGAKAYHIEEDYRKNGIKLVYSDYQPIGYRQTGKISAINMSVIDYLMNCGFEVPAEWKNE